MDPSLRVAANDPHLVSLGGGRLSTAVTIHYIPVGTTTVGSAAGCCISLNGPGIKPLHCTIYRNSNNQVCMQPEQSARTLIDGQTILQKTNLTQGAMITIGHSYYLRFNNPQEAQLIRSVIGSQEDKMATQAKEKTDFLNSIIDTDSDCNATDYINLKSTWNNSNEFKRDKSQVYNNLAPSDINSLQCPKVFTSDLVTVNMPAKDVLGQKYVSFTKNLIENHRNEKNVGNALLNNQKLTTNAQPFSETKLINIPNNCASTCPINMGGGDDESHSPEYLVKVNNTLTTRDRNAFERFPKAAAYGSFPMYPVNNINSVENNEADPERLEDMIKICSEYADRQNQTIAYNASLTSSPIVQNRIKTNGSLPREKKSPFNYDFTGGQLQQSLNDSNKSPRAECSGELDTPQRYDNIRAFDFNQTHRSPVLQNSGYENVIVGKCVPQSPRTKIRTTCLSPKKENIAEKQMEATNHNYEQLIKTFEEKFNFEIKAIEESTSNQRSSAASVMPSKKPSKNINNLTLNLMLQSTPKNSPDFSRKPIPTPRNLNKSVEDYNDATPRIRYTQEQIEAEQLKSLQNDLVKCIQGLKLQISDLQHLHENDVNIKSSDEWQAILNSTNALEKQLQTLQHSMHRLEAQRNATRVMEENKQAKLKQSIEMKEEQIEKLKTMLQQNSNDVCLKEELHKVRDSLENDRKAFEDLEFQYLEEESEWHAYCEELHAEEKTLLLKIEENRLKIKHLERNVVVNKPTGTINENDFLNKHLLNALHELQQSKDPLNILETQSEAKSKEYDIDADAQVALQQDHQNISETDAALSQSLFGSTEIIYSKHDHIPDIMSRSVNENILYNSNNIELPGVTTTTTALSNSGKIKDNMNEREKDNIAYTLSLGYDDFEVNLLDKKTASQDDIDRISKLTVETPITSKGASTKIFDTIKEIERNRQLLLTLQGHHVIEHERQKMHDLKEKIHNEARAQYVSKLTPDKIPDDLKESLNSSETLIIHKTVQQNKENIQAKLKPESNANGREKICQQRYSNPELERNHTLLGNNKARPLSEANSEMSCDILSQNSGFKSGDELSTDDNFDNKKRSGSVNSNDLSSVHVVGRKRDLVKHQRPLTRYLPICSPDLNLRKHIESAGHQISMCPHIFVDAYSCRGYLHKLGATFHGWSRRWFVLDRQCNAFIYYADKSERKPRGGAYFTTIDEVYLDHLNVSKSSRPHCTFIVKTKKRSFHLQAASGATARIWIDALITGAQGNFNYYNNNGVN